MLLFQSYVYEYDWLIPYLLGGLGLWVLYVLLVSNLGSKPCNLLQHFSNAKNYIFTLWVIINVKVHIL